MLTWFGAANLIRAEAEKMMEEAGKMASSRDMESVGAAMRIFAPEAFRAWELQNVAAFYSQLAAEFDRRGRLEVTQKRTP